MPLSDHLIATYKKARGYHGHDGANRVVREVVRESARRGRGADDPDLAKKERKRLRSRFSLRGAAEAAMGPGYYLQLEAYAKDQRCVQVVREAADPSVDATAFVTVAGAVIADQIEDSYEAAVSIAEDLVSPYPTPNKYREVVAKENAFGTDAARTVGEAEEYPKTGVTGNYITIPKSEKIGLMADITLEAVEEDLIGERLDLADIVGTTVGQEWKERIMKVVLGIVNNYKRNGTAYNTYQTTGTWANQLTDFNQANGPEEFDRLDTLLDTMTNPITGKEIKVGGDRRLLVPRANLLRTRRNVTVQEIRYVQGAATVIGGNPMAGLPAPETDAMIRRLLLAAGFTTTNVANFAVYGDLKAAFAARITRDFEVLERDSEVASDVGFRQDIVYAAKARIWGVPFAKRPWVATRGYQ
jgi:hypothetical protein